MMSLFFFFSKFIAFSLLIAVSAAADSSTVLTTDPRCISLDSRSITLQATPVTVDILGSVPGDLSIAAFGTNAYMPSTLPQFTDNFRIENIEMQAICTVRSSSFGAPECRLEFELGICTRLKVIKEDIKLERTAGVRGSDLNEVDSELERGESAEALQLYDVRCGGRIRRGKFTAIGTGPEEYAITGGIKGFFGAFGSVDAVFDPMTQNYVIEKLDLCYYPGY